MAIGDSVEDFLLGMVVCGVIMALFFILIPWSNGFEYAPREFIEMVGVEKCAETGQELERFERFYDNDLRKYRMKFVCFGLENVDDYDSIEVVR